MKKAGLSQPLRKRRDYGSPEDGSMMAQLEQMQELQFASLDMVAKDLNASAGYYYNRRGDLVIDDDNSIVKRVLKGYEELARAMRVGFKWKRVDGQIVVDADDQDGFEEFLNKKGIREIRMASRQQVASSLVRMAKELVGGRFGDYVDELTANRMLKEAEAYVRRLNSRAKRVNGQKGLIDPYGDLHVIEFDKRTDSIKVESYQDEGGKWDNFSDSSIPVVMRKGQHEIVPNDDWRDEVEEIFNG